MNSGMVSRDERTVSVENASFRLAYIVMSYGLLLCTAYRALALKQSSWDLLALVMVGGLVATFYQGSRHILSRRWALVSVAVALVAAVAALALLWR